MMKRVTISQSRVATLLRTAGWKQPKDDVFELFKKHHRRVPGLVKRQNTHKSAKALRTWYQYESGMLFTTDQAEREIAKALAKTLGL